MSKVLCLFAGAGGAASGILAAAPGAQCLGIDHDPAVLQLFQARIPHASTITADVEDMEWWPRISVERFDTMTASPPCPPFSKAGRRLGASDPRAAVWPSLDKMTAAKPSHTRLTSQSGPTRPRPRGGRLAQW